MQILLLTQYFPPEIGAAQARLDYYVRAWAEAGHEVTVLAPPPNYPEGRVFPGYSNDLEQHERYGRVRIVRTKIWPSPGKSFLNRMKWFLSFMMTSFVVGLRLPRPDVIVVENPPLFACLSAWLLSACRRVPYVVHLSDLWIDAAVNFGFLRDASLAARLARQAERLVLTRAAAIISVTDKVQQHAERFADRKRTAMIPNGVDTDLYRRSEVTASPLKSFGLTGRFVVVYAGTMGYQHGLEVIVEAARELADRCPEVAILFVGEGSEREMVQGLVAEDGIDNVRFSRFLPQEDLALLLNSCDVGISTLKRADFTEGVRPVKMFSYMACELPVVATDIGESGRLMRDSGCGIAVPPEDPGAIVQAIARLAADPARRRDHGRRGRDFVEQFFSRRRAARQCLDVLSAVVGGRIDSRQTDRAG